MIHFSTELKATLDHWIAKYPADQKQSAVLPALRFVQEDNGGYLTDELMEAVAAYLDMPIIAVYEVATFYSMYELKPIEKTKVSLCTNISCMLAGCDKVLSHLKTKENITLREVECLGACAAAPVMHIGHKYYEHLTPEKVDEILGGLT